MFLFQCFQSTDCPHVVFKLGLLSAFAQMIIRDVIVRCGCISILQAVKERWFLTCLNLFRRGFSCRLLPLQRLRPEGPVPLITVQQRSQNRFAFRTEDRINHGRIPECDIKESNLIDREWPVIHIDRIARMQIIGKRWFFRRLLWMPVRWGRLIRKQVNGDFPHGRDAVMLRNTSLAWSQRRNLRFRRRLLLFSCFLCRNRFDVRFDLLNERIPLKCLRINNLSVDDAILGQLFTDLLRINLIKRVFCFQSVGRIGRFFRFR